MKTFQVFAIALVLVFTASPALSQTAPVVSNVVGVQRAGTKLVDITYDLVDTDSAELYVTLQISSDAGSTWTVPATSATGQIGVGIPPGSGRSIVWNAGMNWNDLLSTTMRYRITAHDSLTPAGMALIPAGSFTMGRTSGDTDADAPPVSVYVSAFYMAKYEVTKALWDEVRTWGLANGYTDLPVGAGNAEDHPVQRISWYAVVKWCNARSQKEGLTPCYTVSSVTYKAGNSNAVACDWGANGYRLPTEAEREKATRGGSSGQRFPWGDTITHSQANYYSSTSFSYDVSQTRGNHPTYATGTSPVGSFAANGYGLYDTAGNVWDWCWDWYSGSYYVNGASDPRGPASGTNRVLRGGCWENNEFYSRAAFRSGNSPPSDANNHRIGFRTVRSLVPVASVGMALIPAGSFTMGRTSGDTDTYAPPVSVYVSAFYMAKYEVTKALWDEVRTWGLANGYTDLPLGVAKAADHPVQNISWYAVVKWCNARSQKEGRTPCYTVSSVTYKAGDIDAVACNWGANGYRLPTEAEREKAARGGLNGQRFPWGDTITHSQANYYSGTSFSYDVSPTRGYHPTYATGNEPFTSPVGSFAANGYGLYDMAGNVWDWCWDWYSDSYYINSAIDPRGADLGAGRVIRGGGWSLYGASACRACDRGYLAPSTVQADFGFRTASSLVP